MIQHLVNPFRDDLASQLCRPAVAQTAIRRALESCGCASASPRDVRLERVWPDRDGVAYEWSYALNGRRHALFGRHHDGRGKRETTPVDDRPPSSASPTSLFVELPEWGLLVHSPDRDPAMPQLAECLDGRRMSRHLTYGLRDNSSVSDRLGGGPSPFVGRTLLCRPLAYRAGRRASVAYVAEDEPSAAARMVGKTYRNDRAIRTVEIHEQLNKQLSWLTGGRVRVPSPLGYLPEHRMAVLAWAPGESLAAHTGSAIECGRRAAGTLAALHRSWVPHLASFTVADERKVLERWHGLLQRLAPALAAQSEIVFDALMDMSKSVATDRWCTIHRDFYDQQILATSRTTTILDLDTLSRGDPCLDVGNWLAHAFLAHRMEGRPRSVFPRVYASFVDHYGQSGKPVDPARVAFYSASAAFRVGAVHALRTVSGRYAPALWKFAADQLRLQSERMSS